MMTDACTLTAQHTVLGTPIGALTVVREGDLLTGLYFPHHWYKPDPVTSAPGMTGDSRGVAGELEEYLAGSRTCSTCRLRPWHGVPASCLGADHAGSLRADHHLWRPRPPFGGPENAQEVGAAVGRNPLCILIPCHRVIGSNGKLAGAAA